MAVGAASAARLLAASADPGSWFGEVVRVGAAKLSFGVYLGAVASLAVLAARSKLTYVIGIALSAVVVVLPLAWLLPWAVSSFVQERLADGTLGPWTEFLIAVASIEVATFLGVLGVLPRRGGRRWHVRAVGVAAVLIGLYAWSHGYVARDATAPGGSTSLHALQQTAVVAAWLAFYVRASRGAAPGLAVWLLGGCTLWYAAELLVRDVLVGARGLYHSGLGDFPVLLVWAATFAPLVRALDRVTLIPADHPVHDWEPDE